MTTHPNAALIRRFYDAFAAHDAEGMAACYHADVHFSDGAFPELRGEHAPNMWRMLLSRATDLRIEAGDIRADDRTGSARWEAWYTLQATGRHVHNIIEARFELTDGLIVRHTDSFDFGPWSRQAFGPIAALIGWTGLLQRAVQRRVAKDLARFEEKRASGAAGRRADTPGR